MDHKPATIAVQAGRPAHEPDQPLNVPITMASTYVAGGDKEYGRYTNDSWVAFEEVLGKLEGGKALSFASGLAAIATLLDLVNDSVVVATEQSYLGTIGQLADLEARGRLTARLTDFSDTDGVVKLLKKLDGEVALVWIETPTNPGMQVADLPAIIEAAHEAGARVVVDNTFATPMLQQPLSLGADIVIHSATKFIAGHSDVLMGALVVSDEALWDVLKARRDLLGAIPGPFEAWLALRGLRTLPLRVERSAANAAALAERFAAHPAVEEVRYPGFGGMLAVVLPTAEQADLLTHSTSLWVNATSLGGVESTFERRRRWKTESATVPDGLVRLSVGVEDVDDLWDDLVQALDRLVG
ncbi:cystathionine gamma-synthase [Nocardioides luteus]|uniref:Cystathionine gamma-synthase n=1 Tax=Nocardioides luteus TaxID=1844 RepID=A0ABQ5SUQ8_9ACTN|nr:PLP-dependent transferase [Nocardioides luteus]MDR7309753.1 cystathionine gamma-synthase [Nocardioides luteus]GGR61602.1 cystathionine gamma-synthase [Nocardioides luteus]GLJ67338.1 cystathionine gamma-synthase [Nocardioides luteus]